MTGSTIKVLPNGSMYYVSKNEVMPSKGENKKNDETNIMDSEELSQSTEDVVPLRREESEVYTENDDIAEITLTDFAETTDSEN